MSSSKKSDQNDNSFFPLAAGNQIHLQVGEGRFVTTIDTLIQESKFFAALLSGRWDNAQADGSYFIDADPELFEHILRYLRRSVLPIFYDNSKGHDFPLYSALSAEANYFQIPRLENWLKRKGYLLALRFRYSLDVLDGASYLSETHYSHIQSEYHPVWRTRKVYICPRRIAVHRGKPNACGRVCQNAQGYRDDKYEEEQFVSSFVIRKAAESNQDMCTE